MQIGLVAGFGDALGREAWAQIRALGFTTVRTGTGPGDPRVDVMLTDLVEADAPDPLIVLTRQHMDWPDGQRLAAHEITGHALRVIMTAEAIGLTEYSLQIGNEADLSTYSSAPAWLAEAIREIHAAIRQAGFTGDVVLPSVSNLRMSALTYLERVLGYGVPDDLIVSVHWYPARGYVPRAAGDDLTYLERVLGYGVPDDLIVSVHWYPARGYVPRAAGDERLGEWVQLARIAGARRVWVTEFGFHTAAESAGWWRRAPALTEGQATEGLLACLSTFARQGVERAYLYQHRDGPSDGYLDHYGIMRMDGTLKDTAAVPVLWRQRIAEDMAPAAPGLPDRASAAGRGR